jgi:hypothetical protein
MRQALSIPVCSATIVTRTATTWLIAEQMPSFNYRKSITLKSNLVFARNLWPSFLKKSIHSKVN